MTRVALVLLSLVNIFHSQKKVKVKHIATQNMSPWIGLMLHLSLA